MGLAALLFVACGGSNSSGLGSGGAGGSAGDQSGGAGGAGAQSNGGSGGVTGCVNSLDCVDRSDGKTVCEPNLGICVECVAQADCDEGLFCSRNVCAPSCKSDKDCTPLGMLCDFSSGVCAPPDGSGGAGGSAGNGGSGGAGGDAGAGGSAASGGSAGNAGSAGNGGSGGGACNVPSGSVCNVGDNCGCSSGQTCDLSASAAPECRAPGSAGPLADCAVDPS
ncbi:MAG: hypothetical protein KC492_32385, partial [Myxococcales bacterium]|nr:hypothetical protein [Myxococcales bacterium]